eukprot:CAMPEP_0170504670 /NCGR_PEP_ID=MMETSP0208-20121228/48634_1 /TAXON_ID=197538 /ORGANISM="Strombidium inclinatum, Strain S3" /LENGTH=32 /DNA_ID= /DNA_START= /DNA_END= /DNA_ORIENTATION=
MVLRRWCWNLPATEYYWLKVVMLAACVALVSV